MPIFRLSRDLVFPPPHMAEDGLLAVGGDLSAQRLELAYSHGIFPWYSEDDPILWWSPDPRMVLFPGAIHVSKRLARTLKSGRFTLTMDQAFPQVIRACAAQPREGQDGTWILPEMIDAYTRLHEEGLAHSVEAWNQGQLAGGLYGVSIGAAFFGESMFFHEPDASKAALAVLARQLHAWGFSLIDCQQETPHLKRMGASPIPRRRFLKLLAQARQAPTRKGKWRLEL